MANLNINMPPVDSNRPTNIFEWVILLANTIGELKGINWYTGSGMTISDLCSAVNNNASFASDVATSLNSKLNSAEFTAENISILIKTLNSLSTKSLKIMPSVGTTPTSSVTDIYIENTGILQIETVPLTGYYTSGGTVNVSIKANNFNNNETLQIPVSINNGTSVSIARTTIIDAINSNETASAFLTASTGIATNIKFTKKTEEIDDPTFNVSIIGCGVTQTTSNTSWTTNTATPVFTMSQTGFGTFSNNLTAPSFTGTLTGNASSATKIATLRTISLSGDATASGTFDGSENLDLTTTLANSGVEAGTYPKITVDNKGRVTSGTTLVASDIPNLDWTKIISGKPTTLSGYGITNALALTGGILTGALTLNADPTNALHAATKQYVDNLVQGLDAKQSVKAATISNITLSGLQTIDDVILSTSDRVLVKNQTDTKQNGIYVVASGSWTRALDFDGTPTNEISGGEFVFVEQGTINGDNGFVVISNGPITIGTSNISFTQFSGAGQVIPGSNLTKSGNTLSLSDSISLTSVTATAFIGTLTGNASSATKLATLRTISLSGDATASGTFDGSGNLNLTTTLSNSGVVAGTYKSVTVDAKGRVTSGTNPTTLAGYGITDALSISGGTLTGNVTSTADIQAKSLSTNYTFEKTFYQSFGSVANQKIDMYWTGVAYGIIEVEITGGYNSGNAIGKILKRFVFGGSDTGTVYLNTVEKTETAGNTLNYFGIGDISWDATNSRWKFTIAQRSGQNAISIRIKILASKPDYLTVWKTMAMSAIYTTDTTDISNVNGLWNNGDLTTTDNITSASVTLGTTIKETTYSVDPAAVANQKVDLYFPVNTAVSQNMVIQVYREGNFYGVLRKELSFYGTSTGVSGSYAVLKTEASGNLNTYFGIGDVTWDSTKSRWKITISMRSSIAMQFKIYVKMIGSNVQLPTLSSIYTTDTTDILNISGLYNNGPLTNTGYLKVTRTGGSYDGFYVDDTYMKIEVDDVTTTFNGVDSDGYMNYKFNSNGTTRMFINGNSGNVGIGTTSPTSPLHVKTATGVGNSLSLDTTDTTGASHTCYITGKNNGIAKWFVGYGAPGTNDLHINNNDTNGNILLRTNNVDALTISNTCVATFADTVKAAKFEGEISEDYIPRPGSWWKVYTQSSSTLNSDWRSMTYGNGMFVAVSNNGSSNTKTMYSTNGVLWKRGTSISGDSTIYWESITYGMNKFVVVGPGGKWMYSSDGITWSQGTIIGSGLINFKRVRFINNKFVAVGFTNSGIFVYISSDGETWTPSNTINESANLHYLYDVVYAEGKYIAVGNNYSDKSVIATSTDGLTWSVVSDTTINSSLKWTSIAYGNGTFIAVGENGSIRSVDGGSTWIYTSSSYDWNNIIFGAGIFVASGCTDSSNGTADDTIMTSIDGITWKEKSNTCGSALRTLCYYNGMFLTCVYNIVMASGFML